MTEIDQVMVYLGYVVVAAPFLLVMVLGGASLLRVGLSEQTINRLVQVAVVTGLTAAIVILALMLTGGSRHVVVPLGDWVVIHEADSAEPLYQFSVTFAFDRLSVPFAILSFVLTGTIGAF